MTPDEIVDKKLLEKAEIRHDIALELLQYIDKDIFILDVEDVEGHIWWGKFRDYVEIKLKEKLKE